MCVYIFIHTMYIFTRIASYRYALKGAGDESDREYSSTGEVKEDADATAFTRVAEKRRKHMSFGISRGKAV